jgi:hypothetical protein
MRIRPLELGDTQAPLTLRFHLWLSILPDGSIRVEHSGDKKSDELTSKPVLKAGTWSDVVVTFDLKDLKLYVDGELAGQVRARQPLKIQSHYTHAYLGARVGARSDTKERTSAHFHGDIDDLEIIGRALSAEELGIK